MDIRRGTTARIEYKTSLPADQCDILWMTLKQGSVEITKNKGDVEIDADVIRIRMTQEETLSFKEGTVSVQMRGRIGEEAVADKIVSFNVTGILKDGKIGD